MFKGMGFAPLVAYLPGDDGEFRATIRAPVGDGCAAKFAVGSQKHFLGSLVDAKHSLGAAEHRGLADAGHPGKIGGMSNNTH